MVHHVYIIDRQTGTHEFWKQLNKHKCTPANKLWVHLFFLSIVCAHTDLSIYSMYTCTSCYQILSVQSDNLEEGSVWASLKVDLRAPIYPPAKLLAVQWRGSRWPLSSPLPVAAAEPWQSASADFCMGIPATNHYGLVPFAKDQFWEILYFPAFHMKKKEKSSFLGMSSTIIHHRYPSTS